MKLFGSLALAFGLSLVASVLSAAPTITTAPTSQSVVVGAGASFAVTATGSGALSYQWRRNGVPLPGATSATLAFAAVQLADADYYDVQVTDGTGTATAAAIRLGVAPVAYPTNLEPDPTLNLPLEDNGGSVNAVALSGGKIIAGGSFVRVNGTAARRVVRFNSDGSVDATFAAAIGTFTVSAVAAQTDGRVVVGGQFSLADGVAVRNLVRLNADGSLDPAFHPLANGVSVYALAIQADGRILVGGNFGSIGTTTRNALARFNADGTLDTTFNASLTGSDVRAIVVQSDGRIVIGGTFSGVGGTARNNVARLNSDGTLDASFAGGAGFSGVVNALALDAAGRVLAGGNFLTCNGTTVNNFARLNAADGSLDTAFATALGTGFSGTVTSLAVQGDGQLLVGGTFFQFNGTSTSSLVRLDPATGARDSSFAVSPPGFVNGLAVQTDGAVLAAATGGLVRVSSAGAVDSTLQPTLHSPGQVNRIRPAAGGKFVVAGQFRFLGAQAVPGGVARLNADLSLDATFNPGGSGASCTVNDVAVLPDGKLAIVGCFNSYNGTAANQVARLNSDGTLDSAFSAGSGVSPVAPQVAIPGPGGGLYLAGAFTSYNGQAAMAGLVRVNGDGSLDTTFAPGSSPLNVGNGSQPNSALALQPDGRLVVGGSFSSVNGVARNNLVRLNPDGSVDATFATGSAANGVVRSATVLADGRVLIGGDFTTYNGTAAAKWAVLASDGSLSPGFTSGQASGLAQAALAQEDGRFVVYSTTVPSRLLASGAIDGTFKIGGVVGPSAGTYTALTYLPDGSLLLGNNEIDVGAFDFSALMRLRPFTAPAITTQPTGQSALNIGDPVSFSVVAGGSVNNTYQWSKNGVAITGATNATLSIASAALSDGGLYTVTVTNALGSVTSNGAVLSGPAFPPVITSAPAAQSPAPGSTVTLSVTASSSTALSYVWQKNGAAITSANASGVNSATLTLTNVGTADSGSYSVTVTNSAGPVVATAALTITVPRALITVSCRSTVTGGSGDLFAALTIEGATAKQILIRGVGPALSTFGISGTLADPSLGVRDAKGNAVGGNNDWGSAATSPALVAAFQSIGAFPLPDNSKDAAVLLSLAPGTYTVRLGSNVTGGTGAALLEVYDLDSSSGSRLTYAAIRTTAGGSAGTASTGFALTGSGSTSCLVRALGPALGLGNALSDPTLSIQTSQGSAVVSNDNWGTAATQPTLVTAQTTAGAMPLADNSKDAAVLTSLAPGSYTAQIGGNGTTSGLALFEIHVVDAFRGPTPPAFTSGPEPTTLVSSGTNFSLGHVFVGLPAPTFAWTKGGVALTGQTAATLTLNSVSAADAATYQVTATNSAGTGSATETLQVTQAPSISAQPLSQSTTAGGTVTFSVTAAGTPSPTYQWMLNGAAITGATNSSYTIANAQLANAGSYTVVVSNSAGSVTSTAAVLSGSNPAPTITTQPQATTVTAGASATLSVVATAGGTPQYQWRRSSFPIAGATNATFTLPAATRADADFYDVVVNDGLSVTRSQVARLTVKPASYPVMIAADPAWSLAVENTFANGVLSIPVIPAGAATAAGGYYVAGGFTNVGGNHQTMIYRALADGTVDASFMPPDFDNSINAAAIQADGSVIVGGTFFRVGGALGHSFLVRLTPTGALDPTFAPVLSNNVSAIVVQRDGRILIGGNFTQVNGVTQNRLARLNPDGSLDTAFNAGTGFNGVVSALALTPDGSIMAGGGFTTVNNVTFNRLARLTASGALDLGFAPGAGPDNNVNAIAVQASDGAILLGGFFTHYNNVAVGRLARVTNAGALDTGYNTSLGAGFNGTVNAVVLQGDSATTVGTALVGGSFTTVNTTAMANFCRMTAAGALDTTFAPPAPNNTVTAVAVQADGHYLLGGNFGQLGTGSGTNRSQFARLQSNGTLDPISVPLRTANGSVATALPLANGQTLLAGSFQFIRGTLVAGGLARINSDGSVDTSFNRLSSGLRFLITNGGSGYTSAPNLSLSGGGASTPATVSASISGGVLTGLTVTGNGAGYTSAPTVNVSGGGGAGATVVATLNGQGTNGSAVTAAVLLPDGRIAIGGSFGSYNGTTRNDIAVINADGTLDTSFAPTGGLNGQVYALALLPSGKLFAGGTFTTANGVTVNRVAVFNLDGTLDPSFTPGSGANGTVFTAAVQADGRIVLGGTFTSYAGTTRNEIARINANGSLDPSFNPGTGANGTVNAVALAYPPAADGSAQLVLGGAFSSYNGVSRPGLARLNADGSLDTSYAPTAPGFVTAVLVQEDGRVLVRGSFLSAANTPGTVSIFRTLSNGAVDTSFGAAGFSATFSTFAPLAFADSGRVLTGNLGTGFAASVTSGPPLITAPPVDQNVAPGATVTYAVTAQSMIPLSYQWLFNGNPIAGATNASLTIPSAQLWNVGAYSVVVANEVGALTSTPAALAGVGAPPSITTQPSPLVVAAGGGGTLSVASADPGVNYQWYRNGVPIAGATAATFTIANAAQSDSDRYGVVVANGLSGTTSATVPVTVTPTATPHGLKPDATFNLQLESDAISVGVVRVVLPAAGGQFYVAGDFTRFAGANGGVRSHVARFNADGSLDSSFVPPTFDNSVRALALDAGGNLLVGGSFTYVNGAPRPRLVRLTSAGALDASFTTFGSFDAGSAVNALALQSDGKILAGGSFNTVGGGSATGTGFNGIVRTGLVRLNTDGSVDLGYNAALSGSVNALWVLAGDRLVVGGLFTSIAGQSLNNLAVLTAAGAADSTFNPGSGPAGSVNAVAFDGTNLVIGGSFTGFNGTSANATRLARISLAGALDATLATGSGVSGTVNAIAVISGGYLIGGSFGSVGPLGRSGLAKVSSAGVVDTNFVPAVLNENTNQGATINALAVDSSGAVLVGGDFNVLAGAPRAKLARLVDTTGGALDAAFQPQTVGPASAFAVGELPGGQLLVLSNATKMAGSPIPAGLFRLNADGSFDATYNAGGAGLTFAGTGSNRLLVLPDGSALVAGNFNAYNGAPRSFLVKVKPDGTIDPGFLTSAAPNSASINALVRLPAGQILAAGGFSQFGGVTRNGLVRLNADGSIDPTLAAPSALVSTINAAAVDDVGRIYLGGSFTSFSGVPVNRVARLSRTGVLDTGFSVGLGPNNTVNALAVQPDGRVLLGGVFGAVAGASRGGVARLNADGSIDKSFGSVFTSISGVTGFQLQADGSMYVRGTFSAANLTVTVVAGTDTSMIGNVSGIARLSATGVPDQSLGVYGLAGYGVDDFGLLNDGRVVIASSTPSTAFTGDYRAGVTLLQPQAGLALCVQPHDRWIPAGQVGAVIGVEAHNGVAPVRYQWRRNGVALTPNSRYSGIYSRALVFNDPQAADAGAYDCVLTDGTTTITSATGNLVVAPAAPVVGSPGLRSGLGGLGGSIDANIHLTGASTALLEGTPLLWTVSATGTEPLSYQWQLNGVPIAGATDAVFDGGLLSSATAGNYTVVVSGGGGTTTSPTETVTMANSTPIAPVILLNPQEATVAPGLPAYFNVLAAGTGTLSYQWQHKPVGASAFVDVAGATSHEWLVPSVGLTDAGTYRVVVSNAAGQQFSPEVSLALGNGSVWHWRHETPTAQQYARVAFGGGVYAAIGGDEIVTSTDGVTWIPAARLSGALFQDLTYGGGRFVAVTAYGTVATSTNGTNWAIGNLNAAGAAPVLGIYAVVYDGAQFVASAGAPGVRASIFTSPDGLTWTNRGAPALGGPVMTDSFGGIAVAAYGGGTYIAVSLVDQPTLYTSTDLATWTPHALPVTAGLSVSHVSFAGGTFVAAATLDGSNLPVLMRSTDQGATWVLGDHDSASTLTWTSAAGSGSQWVATNSAGSVATSPDAVRWTVDPKGPTRLGSLTDVEWLNNQFVAAGAGGAVLTSADGTTWAERFGRPLGMSTFNAVATGPAGVVAVGGVGQVAFSANGSTWTAADLQTTSSFQGVVYGGGKYVIVGSNQFVWTSPDGQTWTATGNSGTGLNAITYDGTQYVAVGNSGRLATSPDAASWTDHGSTGLSTATLRAVAAGAGALVAAGDGIVLRSTDGGATWTKPLTPSASATLQAAIYAGGQFVISGWDSSTGRSLIYTSPDGATWTSQPLSYSQSLRGLTYAGGRYLAVGGSMSVLTSTDGSTWTADTSDFAGLFLAVTTGPNGVVAVGSNGAIATAALGAAPVVTSVAPSTFGGGASVTVTGSGFTGATAVTFNGAAAANFTVVSDTQITATTPTGVTAGPITVTTAAGTSLPLVGFTAYVAPTITTQPQSTTVADGQTATLSVVASGIPAPTYQWKRQVTGTTGFTAIAGATAATLTGPVTLTDAGLYAVDVTNAAGSVTSTTATLTVTPVAPPGVSITADFGRALPLGGTNGLHAVVGGGSAPIAYQWRLNGTAIAGATDATYLIRNATAAAAGAYTVTASNVAGSVGSAAYQQDITTEVGWQFRNPLPTATSLVHTDFLNGQFFLTGTRGTILTSADTHTWTRHYLPTVSNAFDVAYGAGTYVALGSAGALYTSVDGVLWTPRDSGIPVSSSFVNSGGVAFGNGRFVAVISQGLVTTSTDGLTWTPGSIGATDGIGDVLFLNGHFVALGGAALYTSTDGVTWASTPLPFAGTNSLAYDGTRYVAVGSAGAVATSTDGSAWTVGTAGTTQNLVFVHVLNSRFVATGDGGGVFQSTDGMTWTTSSIGTGLSGLLDATYGNGVYLAVLASTPAAVYTSTDLTTWTAISSNATAANLRGVAADAAGAVIVAVGNNGTIVSSPDGVTWTKRTSGTTAALNGVASGAGQFVAVGGGGVILASSDGTTWASVGGTGSTLNSVSFGNALFITVGANGTLRTSPNGTTWTSATTGTTATLFGTAFGAGLQVAVGANGTILTSPDGVVWSARTSGTTAQLNRVVFAHGQFVAVGINATLTSPDGITWTDRTFTADTLNSVTFVGGYYLATASSANFAASTTYYVSPDGSTWSGRVTGAQPPLFDATATASQVIAVGNSGTILAAAAPIVTAPASTTVPGGGTATFAVLASGSATPPTYQWLKRAVGTSTFNPIAGGTSPTLTISHVTAADAGDYAVAVTNSFSTTTSTPAALSVSIAPAITQQPVAVTVNAGQPATLTVAASGSPVPTYQWFKQATGASTYTAIAGATNASFTLPTAAPADAGSYEVVVANGVGTSVTSTPATLTVVSAAPAFTAQPAGLGVYAAGAALNLVATAIGTPAPTYQWRKDGTPISGATSAAFSVANLGLGDAGTYDVVATNSIKATASTAVPVIVFTPPAAQTVLAGQSATFSVTAAGPSPTFQWGRNGVAISGATASSLTLSNLALTDGGSVTVTVGSSAGSATSAAAALTVNPVAPVISSPTSISGVVGRSLLYAILINATPATFSSSTLPAGLTLDASAGVISGTPTAAGTFAVDVTAGNGTGSDKRTVTFTVLPPPPIINSALSASARVGTSFSYTVQAVNLPTGYGATGLPDGLTLNSATGVISGSPTVYGTFTVTLSATNAGGTVTRSLTLTVDPPLNAPVYSGPANLSGTQGAAFSFTPAFGAATSYALVAQPGGSPSALPAGLTFTAATGVISGTPTQIGVFPLVLQATNAGGATTANLTLTINPAPTAPVITSASTASGVVGTAFSLTLSSAPAATSFAATGLPAGLTLNATTGVIAGTPTAFGTFTVSVTATNAVGTGPSSVVLLSIAPSPAAPTLTNAAVVSGRVNDPLTFALSATQSPTAYALTAGTMPAGLGFDPTTGAIAGTPNQAGQFHVWFAASNNAGSGYALEVLFSILPASTTPVITSNGSATGQVGQPFQYVITATNAPTAFTAAGLPAGLTLNASTGVISGLPLEATTTPLAVTLTAANPDASLPKTLSLTITPAPATPQVTSATTAGGTVGVAFSYQVTASDAPTSFAAAGLPPGLSLNAASGAISGTPSQAGTFTVTLRAGNAAGVGSATTLVVNIGPALAAPAITSAASTSGKVGVALTYTTIATPGPVTSYALTGTLPLGLTFNTATGVLSGKPAASGLFNVQLSATGAGGTSLPQSLLILVNPADNVPVIISPIFATATVGQAFSYTIGATNLNAVPVTFDAVGLPDGLALNQNTGVIAGTPTATGAYTVTLVATNAAGSGPSRTLTLFVLPAVAAPVVTSGTYAAAQVGQPFAFPVTATNGPTSFNVDGAPGWMVVNTATGVLSGTPNAPGTITLSITASNGAGTSYASPLTLAIAPAANTPVITSSRTAIGTVGTAFTYAITASNAPTAFVATGLPAGLALSSSGVISGTPAASGQYEVTVFASNGNGIGAPVTLILTLQPNLSFVVPTP